MHGRVTRARASFLVAVVLVAPGCQAQFGERVTGAAIGAGAGMVVGGLLGSAVGGTAGGVVLGGIAGGAAGYVIGDWIQSRREACECGTEGGGSPCDAPPPATARPSPGPCTPPSPLPDPDLAYASHRAPVRESAASAAARREYEAGRLAVTADEALVRYDAAIRLDPSRPEPWNAQGIVHLYAGRTSEARASFRHALSLDPSYAPASYNLRRLGSI
jgi:hypothetical protein